MKVNYEAVLNHLLFHKALISDQEAGERINRYLKMLEEIEKGMHIAVQDPLEKSIAAAFELVIEHQFDPWDINLVEFSKMYLKKVRKEDYVNFVTAGGLLLMAWSILKLQSDEVLIQAEPPKAEECFFGNWDLGTDFYQNPEDLDYTNIVLNRPEAPIQEAIRRQGKRAVTLMELMDALDEARREAELQMQREALRQGASRKQMENFGRKVHKEDLSEDISLTWARISKFNGNAVALDELFDHDIWDRVTIFMSVLYLAQMRKIKIWQRNFPYGDILVKSIVKDIEEMPLLAELKQVAKEKEELVV